MLSGFGLAQRLARPSTNAQEGKTYEEIRQLDEMVIRPWHMSQREEIIRKAMAAGMTRSEAIAFAGRSTERPSVRTR